jgi:hypothetical protein
VSFRDTCLKGVKFNGCIFKYTSFSLAQFIDCEFRNCSYEKISLSGNTTVFENTYIDSKAFLKDVYLNRDKDVLKKNKTTLHYQSYRARKTKSEIARKIMHMRPVINDLDMLISSVKIARRLEIESAISESFYFIIHGSERKKVISFFNFVFSAIEYPVVNIFGWLTGWGYKIGKTVLFGILSMLLFSVIYDNFIYVKADFVDNLLKSFEYGLLFGYTKYPMDKVPMYIQWIHFLNSFFGMIWFSALIPVVLNKMSNDDN